MCKVLGCPCPGTITVDGKDIERLDHVKLLGVTVSSNLTCNMHVDNLTAKAGKMLYTLYQLKRAGLSKKDRTRIYLRVVRPTNEYACPIWHTGLPKYLSDGLEMIQKRALRSIYIQVITMKIYWELLDYRH